MMTKMWRIIKRHSKEKGQSLVEIALVLPIFILIIAGIVEVANLLNTQNKLTTASRIAAGYGAANYDRDNFVDLTAPDMGLVALNTVTETLELDVDRWDIWSVAAQTDDNGTGFEVFTYTQVYGTNNVVTSSEWDSTLIELQTDILDALQAECEGDPAACASNIEVVASVPFFRQNAILGLEISKWANLDKLRGLTVMRVDDRPSEFASLGDGCPLLPIAVRIDDWALYPSDWLEDRGEEEDEPPFTRHPSTAWNLHDVQPFPPSDTQVWEFPKCIEGGGPPCTEDDPIIPIYDNERVPESQNDMQIDANPDKWEYNLPGYSLQTMINDNDFREGYLFWAREETDDLGGNFGWLTWDGAPSAKKLKDSLDYPDGDFIDFYPGSRADNGELVNINDFDPLLPNFEGLSGNGNEWLEVGEWVEGVPGNMDVAGKNLEMFIYNDDLTTDDKSTEVVLILFDELNDDSGSNTNYQVAGFMLSRVLGYSFGGNNNNDGTLYEGKWIVFELLGKASKCYDPPD